jgi:uncharacterized RDD family membrane protein YckC
VSVDGQRAAASLRVRLGAALLDVTALALTLVLASRALLSLGVVQSPARPFAVLFANGPGLATFLGALTVLAALFWAALRGTPGQLLMGCRVVPAGTGRRLSLARALLRALAAAGSVLPLGLGVLWVAWDPRKQAWHDKMVDSLVVLEDESRLSMEELREALG